MRIGIFIDYANLLASSKTLGWDFDFQKLVTHLQHQYASKCDCKCIYFAYLEEGTRKYDLSGIHKFWTFLEKGMEFRVVKKKVKRIRLKDKNGNYLLNEKGEPIHQEKWNLDVEITIDVMCFYRDLDIILLFSGDSDFHALIKYLQQEWKQVHVFSTWANISSELQSQANKYIDISKLKDLRR